MVTNSGSVTATNLVITDTLDTNLTIVGQDAMVTELGPATVVKVAITTTIKAGTAPKTAIKNVASVSAANAAEASSNTVTHNVVGLPSSPTPTSPPTNTPTATTVPPTNTPTATTVPPTNTPTATTVPPTNTPTATTVPPTNTPTATTIPPTNTPTTPAPSGDSYEIDNTCAEAKAMLSDGTIQEHTFHAQADEDWVKFEGVKDTTYLIQAQTPVQSTADVVLEMYGQCNGLTIGNQGYAFSPDVRMEIKAPSSGSYYLKLSNQQANVFGSQASYQLSVRVLGASPMLGAVIIVAGKIKENDYLQPNIYEVASNELQAEVQDDKEVKSVWAYLYPPSYQPPADTGNEMTQETLMAFQLINKGKGQWAVKYPPLSESGTYRLVIYAEDDKGLTARPFALEVNTSQRVYLPLIMK